MRIRLTIDVTIDDATADEVSAISTLNNAAMHLASNGLLADEFSVVDEWSHQVDVLSSAGLTGKDKED